MTLSLSPNPKAQFFSNSGLPLAGGYLYTYSPGAPSVYKATYVNSDGSPNTNPIVLDSAGRASIWLDGFYYMELWTGDKTAAGSTLLWTQDNVSTGSVTYAGPQGIPGAQGPQGVTGNQGPQGEIGTQGYQGDQGVMGYQGPGGTDGSQGFQGDLGPQGFQGFAGTRGPQGITGAGLNQRGPWASGSTYAVGDAVSDTGNYYVCIVAVANSTTSPPGDTTHFNLVAAQGAQGAEGAEGPQGNAGPQGFVGAQGATGPQGAQGFQGALGPQGNIGPQGNVGSQGALGPQGYMGSQGPYGAQGGVGPQGSAGAIGATGATGMTGSPGPTGATGPTGSAGANAVSTIARIYNPNSVSYAQNPAFTTIQNLTIVSTGYPVIVMAGFLSHGVDWTRVNIYRGGSLIYSSGSISAVWTLDAVFYMSMVDDPGAGSFTYSIQLSGNGPNGVAHNISFILMEIKA